MNRKSLCMALMSLFFIYPAFGGESKEEPTTPPAAAEKAPEAEKTKAPKKPKSSFSTEIYLKESNLAKFTDTVRVLREGEVFFAKRGGPYTIPTDATAMERLIDSMKGKAPVEITYDETNQKIHSVGKPSTGK